MKSAQACQDHSKQTLTPCSHTHARPNIWEENGCGDISPVKMSPAVGVGTLLKWHLHTFTLRSDVFRTRACMGLQRTIKDVREAAKTPPVEGCTIHNILQDTWACLRVWWGVSVLPHVNMAENRLRHHSQSQGKSTYTGHVCVCVCYKERERLASVHLGMSN